MECPVCLNVFGSAESLPLVIPCGHTICNSCLREIYNTQNLFCPLDRTELPPQSQIHPNYALIETLQHQNIAKDIVTCCNGHPLEELIQVFAPCSICSNPQTHLWFCAPCRSGICQQCKSWHTNSTPLQDQSLKCFRNHSLRLTQKPSKFYTRKGKFLCDGCMTEAVGSSAHCHACMVDFCMECLKKLNELVSSSTNLRCVCSKQIVWRSRETCHKCTSCRNLFNKSGSFTCVECQKRYCLICSYVKFLGIEPEKNPNPNCESF